MQEQLSGKEFIDIEAESVLPVSEEIMIVGEHKQPGLICDIGSHTPIHSVVKVATDLTLGMFVGGNTISGMINYVVVFKAYLQIIRKRGYSEIELECAKFILVIVGHTKTHIQVGRRHESGSSLI